MSEKWPNDIKTILVYNYKILLDMKNTNLISRFNDLKKSKSIENIEGEMLKSIKGGLLAPCSTKCKTNTACNSNAKESLEAN